MALLSSISSSLTGMKVAQSQLEIVSNNIANMDNVGYTRKTAAQSALVSAGTTMGVTMENVKRNVDEGLLKNFLASKSKSSSLSAQYDYLQRVDVLLGTAAESNSIATDVSDLQSAIETFSTQVTSAASRYTLLTSANALTDKLNYLSSNIQNLQQEADKGIKDLLNQVNSLLGSINSLNSDIVKYQALNSSGVADLQDQRDDALRSLSSLLNITYYTRDTGALVVQTADGKTLLDAEVHEICYDYISSLGADNNYIDSNAQGIFVDGRDITSSVSQGEIGGLLQIKDITLPALQAQLDETAYVLYWQMNEAHNQGTAYPDIPSVLSGSNAFIADSLSGTYNQNIRLDNGGDVRFVIFDADGNQKATASLIGDMGFSATGDSLADMISRIQTWLQSSSGAGLSSARVYMNSDSHLVIDTGDTSYGISIIDEVSSSLGAEQSPVNISFDANGDGIYDQTFQGFSSFFGLNDFFAKNIADGTWDSKSVNLRAAVGSPTTTRWSFSDSFNGFDYGYIDISRTMTISDIAEQINNNSQLNTHIQASLLKSGDGYTLRISSIEGAQLEIIETSGGGILNKLNMAPSACNYASSISVREDIKQNSGLIVAGSPDYDANFGRYVISAADNNIANKLAATLADNHFFRATATMAQTTTTIANYVSGFVGNVAAMTNTAEKNLEYQNALTQAISDREAQDSGVNLDEELAQMIIYQQSYAACAQVFTASRELLDVLLGMV